MFKLNRINKCFKFFYCVLFLTILFNYFSIISADIDFQLDRHFPCPAKHGPLEKNLLLKFASYKSLGTFVEPVKNDSSGHNCIRIKNATVEIFPPGLDAQKKYHVHLETRIGLRNKPEKCIRADKNGCGGFGSCVHCDICDTLGKNLSNIVTIQKQEKTVTCNSLNFSPGSHKDISLKICLPTIKDFFSIIDPNPKNAENILKVFATTRNISMTKIPLVILAKFFNQNINNLTSDELNDVLFYSKKGMIGCHMLFATIIPHL